MAPIKHMCDFRLLLPHPWGNWSERYFLEKGFVRTDVQDFLSWNCYVTKRLISSEINKLF